MQIIKKINLRVERFFARLKFFLGIDVAYKYQNFSIKLPPTHLLPLYQENHRLYDRFLPHLAGFLKKNDWVIDVGANCGDTLASMVNANPGLNFYCIEPDDEFFLYLKKNASLIVKSLPTSSIFLEKCLVGKSVKLATLTGVGGTKRSIVNFRSQEGGNRVLRSAQLDDVYVGRFGNSQPVRLIKSDVDGFDFDVIDSASGLVQKWSPLVYFEMHCFDIDQKNGFESTIHDLAKLGYVHWAVFDNFGELVLNTHNICDVIQLGDYVWRMNLSRSTRTVYYFDVLACCSNDVELVSTAIRSYCDL